MTLTCWIVHGLGCYDFGSWCHWVDLYFAVLWSGIFLTSLLTWRYFLERRKTLVDSVFLNLSLDSWHILLYFEMRDINTWMNMLLKLVHKQNWSVGINTKSTYFLGHQRTVQMLAYRIQEDILLTFKLELKPYRFRFSTFCGLEIDGEFWKTSVKQKQ